MVWVPWWGQDSSPIEELSLSLFWGQQQSPFWKLHQGPRVWQWWGPGQSDSMTRSRLCPRCSAFLDSCSFSELSFLAFHSDTVSIIFWSELLSCVFLLESRNADHYKLEVYDTARAHSQGLCKADSQYLVPIARITLMVYYYTWHSKISYPMLHLFRCPECVIFCWGTNLNWEEYTLDHSLFDFFYFFYYGDYMSSIILKNDKYISIWKDTWLIWVR